MAIGFFLLLMQGIVKFIRDIKIAAGRETAVAEQPGVSVEGE